VAELVCMDGDSLNLLTGGFLALWMLAKGLASSLVRCDVSTLYLAYFIRHGLLPSC
jgi:hypothetical protein